jgi:hypothetical protein
VPTTSHAIAGERCSEGVHKSFEACPIDVHPYNIVIQAFLVIFSCQTPIENTIIVQRRVIYEY